MRGEQGSGPEGVDDLCFHTYGEFSPPPYSSASPPLQPPPPSLRAHISAWRPISQPGGPNPSLEAQIPSSRPKSQPQGPDSSHEAQIPIEWILGLEGGIWASRLGFEGGIEEKRKKKVKEEKISHTILEKKTLQHILIDYS